ncbi:TatD family hydrolase [Halalkalibacter nanhaiisediminis]|uniref:TatD DNase family protein n=1 Tax=Halalkalibacter nanhaiisediminis TaxID=688079 RepID=A0A562QQT1_9BACI|nr:TatD family hydrolase [Halalkalibacter nanhaiisediminis]TWI59112.1 TatD DNase family protein [Halalkalibacter nanhaiisediminis]
MIDAHIHLEQYENIHKKIDEWKLAGMKGVIAVSNDLASSYRTLELQTKYPNFVYAAVGFHPENPLPKECDFMEWQSLISTERDKITAIGEIGLPYYNLDQLPHSLLYYIEFLEECLAIALKNDLPVALHAVHDKTKMVFDLLQKHQMKHAHFHWLKAPKDVLELIVKEGYYVSVTPEVCYRKRDQQLASSVPLDQLLIETDGPWRFNGPYENRDTSPLFLEDIVHTISQLKKQSSEEIREKIYQNTHLCYRL